ncbi:hypothetical protein [Paenibacillus sp. FSL R7-0337]|uniref:hypothetical protein n=1 Tax=unclassified Paenibacillus TaxID=185978 RepID=UPI00096CF1A2|nr:hypothetical protein [Paenibacillus sp. FSL R7-0337]OMF94218.1 hypothetical protein BK147_16885 [Paenibacillus sp. FSL R7-0337]
MNLASYESIKSSIVIDFEEYIEEEGLNVAQVSAKILEEDWRIVNDSLFTKTLYIFTIAIESLKYKEIADFIYSRLNLENNEFEEDIDKNDIEMLTKDIQICKKLIANKGAYKIRETSHSVKSRVEYILTIKGGCPSI